MDASRVDMYMMANQKFFPEDKIMNVREKLMSLDDSRFKVLQTISFKDPTTMLIISLFLGELGVDRFMLGDTGLGVLKLFTFGLCGILLVYDWITIMSKCKEKNYIALMSNL